MPRRKQTKTCTIGRKRQNPSRSKPKAKKRKLNSSNKVFAGMQICITGSLKLQQKEMIKLITDHGGKRNATCSKKCNYLIMNNSTSSYGTTSSKCKKAKENNIPIIREQWLYDCIEESEILDIDGADENGMQYVIFWREKRKLPKYPKHVDINNHHKRINNVQILNKLLLNPNTRDFAMILCYKALNRFPGGNADMHVIKYILLVNGEHVLLQKITRSNWDGINYISKKPFVLKVENILDYIQNIAETFVDLYLVDKKQNICAQVVDKRFDSEESDTEWTHLDFNIYIAPKYNDDDAYDNNSNNSKKAYDRRYKSDECEAWSESANIDGCVIDVVDDYIGDYDIERDWLQMLSFERKAIYCSGGYGANRKIPKPKPAVTEQGEKLIKVVSDLCGVIRPINETPYDDTIVESRSSKDNKALDKDVELDMGKIDCYDMKQILLKGYDY